MRLTASHAVLLLCLAAVLTLSAAQCQAGEINLDGTCQTCPNPLTLDGPPDGMKGFWCETSNTNELDCFNTPKILIPESVNNGACPCSVSNGVQRQFVKSFKYENNFSGWVNWENNPDRYVIVCLCPEGYYEHYYQEEGIWKTRCEKCCEDPDTIPIAPCYARVGPQYSYHEPDAFCMPRSVPNCSQHQYVEYNRCKNCTECSPGSGILQPCTRNTPGFCSVCAPGTFSTRYNREPCQACEECPLGQYRINCQQANPGTCIDCDPCDDGKVRLDMITCSECISTADALSPFLVQTPYCPSSVSNVGAGVIDSLYGGYTYEQLYQEESDLQCSERCNGSSTEDTTQCQGPYPCGVVSCLELGDESTAVACPYDLTPAEENTPWLYDDSVRHKLTSPCERCTECGKLNGSLPGYGRGCAKDCSFALCESGLVWDWTDASCKRCSDLQNISLCGYNYDIDFVTGAFPRIIFAGCQGAPTASYGTCQQCPSMACTQQNEYPAHNCECAPCARSDVQQLQTTYGTVYCQLLPCAGGFTGVNPAGNLCARRCTSTTCPAHQKRVECTLSQDTRCVSLYPEDTGARQALHSVDVSLLGLSGSFENALVDELALDDHKFQCVYNAEVPEEQVPGTISKYFFSPGEKTAFPRGTKFCRPVSKHTERPLLPLQNVFYAGTATTVFLNCPARVASYDYTGAGDAFTVSQRHMSALSEDSGMFYLSLEMRNVHNATLEFSTPATMSLWQGDWLLTADMAIIDDLEEAHAHVNLMSQHYRWWKDAAVLLDLKSAFPLTAGGWSDAPGFITNSDVEVKGTNFWFSTKRSQRQSDCLANCSCAQVCADLCSLRCISDARVTTEPSHVVELFGCTIPYQESIPRDEACHQGQFLNALVSEEYVFILAGVVEPTYLPAPDDHFNLRLVYARPGMNHRSKIVSFNLQVPLFVEPFIIRMDGLIYLGMLIQYPDTFMWLTFGITDYDDSDPNYGPPFTASQATHVKAVSSVGSYLYTVSIEPSAEGADFKLRQQFLWRQDQEPRKQTDYFTAQNLKVLVSFSFHLVERCTMKSTAEKVFAIACWSHDTAYFILCTIHNCMYQEDGSQFYSTAHTGRIWVSWLNRETQIHSSGDALFISDSHTWIVGSDIDNTLKVHPVSSPLEPRQVLAYEKALIFFDAQQVSVMFHFPEFTHAQSTNATTVVASTAVALDPIQTRPALTYSVGGVTKPAYVSNQGMQEAYVNAAFDLGKFTSIDYFEYQGNRILSTDIEVTLTLQTTVCYNLYDHGAILMPTNVQGPASGTLKHHTTLTLVGDWVLYDDLDCQPHLSNITYAWASKSFVLSAVDKISFYFESEDNVAIGIDNVKLVPLLQTHKVIGGFEISPPEKIEIMHALGLADIFTHMSDRDSWPRQHWMIQCRDRHNVTFTLKDTPTGCRAVHSSCVLELPLNAAKVTIVTECQNFVVTPSPQVYECEGHNYFSVNDNACVSCGFSCDAGFRDVDCAAFGEVQCESCGQAPANSMWGEQCSIVCKTGYYLRDGICVVCSPTPSCEPGFVATYCSQYMDSRCLACPGSLQALEQYTGLGCETTCITSAFKGLNGECIACATLTQLQSQVNILRAPGNFVRYYSCSDNEDSKFEYCDIAPVHSKFVDDGLQFDTDCEFVCDDGYYRNVTGCDVCKNTPSLPNSYRTLSNCTFECHVDYVKKENECVLCNASQCSVGEYLANCTTCQPCTLKQNDFVFIGRGLNDDASSCPQQCKPGSYLKFGYGLCVNHTNVTCKSNEYKVHGTAYADFQCRQCSSCEGQKLLESCSNHRDAVCLSCGDAPDNAAWAGVATVSQACSFKCNTGYTLDKITNKCEYCTSKCAAGFYQPTDPDNCTHCEPCTLPSQLAHTDIEWLESSTPCLWACGGGKELVGDKCEASSMQRLQSRTASLGQWLTKCSPGSYLTLQGCTVCDVVIPALNNTWEWVVPGNPCEWRCLNAQVKHFYAASVRCRNYTVSTTMRLLENNATSSRMRRSLVVQAQADETEGTNVTLLIILLTILVLLVASVGMYMCINKNHPAQQF